MVELTLTERYLRRIARLLSALVVLLLFVAAYCAYDAFPRISRDVRFRTRVFTKASELLAAKEYTRTVTYCERQLGRQQFHNDPWMYWYIGEAHYRMSNWKESVAAMERALELKPDFKQRIQPYLDVARRKIKEPENPNITSEHIP